MRQDRADKQRLQDGQEGLVVAVMTRDQEALVAGAAPALFAEALRQFGRVHLRASGRSMLPAIEPGDVLEVEYAVPERIEVGDVILYDAGGRLLAHRVVTKIVDRER